MCGCWAFGGMWDGTESLQYARSSQSLVPPSVQKMVLYKPWVLASATLLDSAWILASTKVWSYMLVRALSLAPEMAWGLAPTRALVPWGPDYA